VNVLVDTCVWSLVFRRRKPDRNGREQEVVRELAELVGDDRARILGLVRQELLTGIKTTSQFEKLRQAMAAFPNVPVDALDYEAAAKVGNDCIAGGIAVATVDMLICAVAHRRGMSIFTTDPDFARYARVLPLKLHSVSDGKTVL
jgi:predicted nucleic acid-binding protein